MKRRISADTLVLVGFLVLLGLASARIAATTATPGKETAPHRTVTSALPGGWKALRLLLEARGAKTALIRQEAKKWPGEAGLIVTGPEWFDMGSFGRGSKLWDKDGAEIAKAWITKGGTLVHFTDTSSALTEALGIREIERLESKTIAPADPTELLSGVQKVETEDIVALLPKGDTRRLVPLLSADNKPVGFIAKYGRGRLILVGSAAFCDNTHLGKTDNAALATRLIESYLPKNKTVYFDEFHQGFEEGKTFFQVIGAPGQRLLWQAAGVLLLLAVSAGWRFGLPLPPPSKKRLSSEYVSSVGDLYRRAGARDAALESALGRLRGDLAGRVGLAHDAPDGELSLKAAAALGGSDPKGLAERLTRLLADCREALARQPKEFTQSDLLTLAQRIETLRKETGIDGV